MPAKPTVKPEWATTDLIDGTSGENNVAEPTAARKASGWNFEEKPTRQWWNWLQRIIYTWIDWLDGTTIPLTNSGTTTNEQLPDGTGHTHEIETGVGDDQIPTNGDLSLELIYMPSEAVYLGSNLDASLQTSSVAGCSISEDGSEIIVCGSSDIYLYDIPDPADLSGAMFSGQSLDTTPDGVSVDSFFRSNDGLRFFIGDSSTIRYYLLTDRLDFSTAAYQGGFSLATDVSSIIRGLAFSEDGKSLFVVEPTAVHSYSLSTAWDLNTRVHSPFELTPPISPSGLFLSSDKNQIVLDATGLGLYKYSLPNYPSLEDSVQVGAQGGASMSDNDSFSMNNRGHALRYDSDSFLIEAWGVPAVLKKRFYA